MQGTWLFRGNRDMIAYIVYIGMNTRDQPIVLGEMHVGLVSFELRSRNLIN